MEDSMSHAVLESIALHLYGLHTNDADRYAFDPEKHTIFPDKISPLV
jgi:hypothetical protein